MAATVSTWVISTLAGDGEPGFAGDGGPSQQARLNEPKGVTVDRHGHVYVADSENHVIRRIDRVTGIISTVAGVPGESQERTELRERLALPTTDEDPLADSSRDSERHRYVQQSDLSGTVRYVMNGTAPPKRYAGDGGPAVEAFLNFPTAVVVDRDGTLFIADTMNHRVRMVEAATGVMTTLAGTGQARFSGDGGPANLAALNEPAALALDDEGRLYIADQSNHRVRMVDLKTSVIWTVAGTGVATYDGDGKPATDAALAGPSGLVLVNGRLYIADTFNGRIRCVTLSTGLVSTAAGDGATYRYESSSDPPSSSLSRPSGITVDHHGTLFLTDSDSHLIRRWDWEEGAAVCVAGHGVPAYSGDGGVAREASLCYPFGIVADRDGTLLIADTFNHRIRTLALE